MPVGIKRCNCRKEDVNQMAHTQSPSLSASRVVIIQSDGHSWFNLVEKALTWNESRVFGCLAKVKCARNG